MARVFCNPRCMIVLSIILIRRSWGCTKLCLEVSRSNRTTFNNKVKAHSTCPTHIKCASAMVSFIEVQSGNQLTINTSLSSHCRELYHHKSRRLDVIIDCIILCGKQNISLRGPRNANCSSHSATNMGYFNAMPEFRALHVPVI